MNRAAARRHYASSRFSARASGALVRSRLCFLKNRISQSLSAKRGSPVSTANASARFAGKTLGEAWREMPADWRGTRFAAEGEFPLLVKFIFPKEMLSHPGAPGRCLRLGPRTSRRAAAEKPRCGTSFRRSPTPSSSGPETRRGQKDIPRRAGKSHAGILVSSSSGSRRRHHLRSCGNAARHRSRNDRLRSAGVFGLDVSRLRLRPSRRRTAGHANCTSKKPCEVIAFRRDRKGGKMSPLSLFTGALRNTERTLLAACSYFATERWEVAATVRSRRYPRNFDLIVIACGKGRF